MINVINAAKPIKRRRRILRLNSQPEIRASGEELEFKSGISFISIAQDGLLLTTMSALRYGACRSPLGCREGGLRGTASRFLAALPGSGRKPSSAKRARMISGEGA